VKDYGAGQMCFVKDDGSGNFLSYFDRSKLGLY
jgi:hypothetical protein